CPLLSWVAFEMGKGADGDRLERGAGPIGADFSDRFAEDVGDNGRDHRPADPALTGPHPAAGKRLELVRARGAEPRRTADPANRHLLAAAGYDVVFGRDQHRS